MRDEVCVLHCYLDVLQQNTLLELRIQWAWFHEFVLSALTSENLNAHKIDSHAALEITTSQLKLEKRAGDCRFA